jgi:hypothetical protein
MTASVHLEKITGRNLGGSDCGQIEELSRNFSEGTVEHDEKPVTTVGIPAETRTEHLPDASVQRYC